MAEITYNISEICEKLNCESHNLRYLEKALELLIQRDKFQNRVYGEKDLANLEMIMDLKEKGLNFAAIKKVLAQQEQVAETAVEETRSDLVIQNKNLDTLINLLTTEITKSVEKIVNPRFEALTNELENFKKTNIELQEQLLHQQQEHFKNVDEKLNKWREGNNKQEESRGFFSNFFRK